jgi:lipid-A-disaccharide synthase-like uncharacterized protein
MRDGSDGRRSLKQLNWGLCVLGAAGALAGMLLESHPLFLIGIGVGVLGYLGARRELRRDLEKREQEEGPFRR